MVDHERFGFDPGSVFDGVAAGYQANRPSYPEGLFDALERLVGPLSGRRVVDVGAGTGISTRALAARGARVLAVDPSLSMARTLRAASERLPASLGRAEAIPVVAGGADLVTFAQAWHWVRVPEAAAECRRVLGRRGRLALWWNMSQDPGPFFDDLWNEGGITRYGVGAHQDDRESLVGVGGFSDLLRASVRWEWTVPIEHWMQTIETRSELAKLGDEASSRLRAIEGVARRHFPGGEVTEWFTTRLTVAVP